MPDGEPCGRIVVCTGGGIHAARADPFDDAVALPSRRRLCGLHDAPLGWAWFAKIEL